METRIAAGDYIVTPMDGLNWIVGLPKLNDDGTQATDAKGHHLWRRKHYYPKLEMALAFVLTKRIEANVRDDIKSVLAAIETARDEIMGAVSGAGVPVAQKGAPAPEAVPSAQVPLYDIG